MKNSSIDNHLNVSSYGKESLKNMSFAKKAYFLQLKSKALAQGLKSGSFKSLNFGQGIDFNGVREYLDGDDVRAIDWNVTARMGRPYVKLFEEEKELNVFLILDASLSMRTGTGDVTRIEQAVECASLMAFAALQNGNSVGSVIFDGHIRFSCPPKYGIDNVMLLVSNFEKTISLNRKDDIATGSVLDNALKGTAQLLKKRSLIMIFSDFRTEQWSDSFARLCQEHDVIATRIVDPSDDRLPDIGAVPFIDPESGIRLVLQTSSSKFRRQWSNFGYHHLENWRHECLKKGGSPLVISTNGNPLPELTRFFGTRYGVKNHI